MPASPPPANPAPPPPPWRLRAEVVIVPALVPVAAARAVVPGPARVIPVCPGRTLGGVVFASYEGGSTLRYREQLGCAGLVALDGRVGLWVSHIHVDSVASREGGRRWWALAKELASFEQDGRRRAMWTSGERVAVVTGRPRIRLPLAAAVPFFGALEGEARWTVAAGLLLAGPVRARVEAPPTGPLAAPAMGALGWGLAGRARIVVPAPRARHRLGPSI